jgi:hypothetical protein
VTNANDLSERARQLADQFIDSTHGEFDPVRYRAAMVDAFKAALQAERDLALEEAAEICDHRQEHGDVFAEQIRRLKSAQSGG